MLEGLAEWVCREEVPAWVNTMFQLERSDEDDRTSMARTNSRLFRLADEMKQRSRRLARILSRGLHERAVNGPLLFGGLYLAGMGSAPGEQAFVNSVLGRLVTHQSCVYWNAATNDREAACRRLLRIGWALLAGLGGVVLTLLLFLLNSS
jgi:hypothetical protein